MIHDPVLIKINPEILNYPWTNQIGEMFKLIVNLPLEEQFFNADRIVANAMSAPVAPMVEKTAESLLRMTLLLRLKSYQVVDKITQTGDILIVHTKDKT